MGELLQHRQVRWILSGFLAACLIFALARLRVFDLADAYWLKSCFGVRKALGLEQAHPVPVVLVPVTSQSIEKVGSWPWDRSLWGEVTEKLEKAGARVIAYDIDFSTPGASDARFASALKKNVLLPLWLEYQESGKASTKASPIRAGFPSPALRKNSQQGFVNVQTGTLGVRRTLLVAGHEGKLLLSLPLRAYLMYTGAGEVTRRGGTLRAGDLRVPLDEDGALWINYRHRDLTVVPADVVLDPKFRAGDLFKGKIALIGVTSPVGQDIKVTPIGARSGLDIQAQVLSSLLDRSFIHPVRPWMQGLFLMILGALLGAVLPRYSWKRFLPWGAMFLAVLAAVCFFLFVAAGLFVEIFSLVLLVVGMSLAVTLWQSRKTESELETKREELELMSEVSQLQTGDLSLSDLLSAAVEMIEEVMQAGALGILLEDDQGRLVLQAWRGVEADAEDRVMESGQGICGRVKQTGKPVLVQEWAGFPHRAKFEERLEISSFLAVPMRARGETKGVLWVGSILPGAFDREAERRLFTVASQLAIGVENCDLTNRLSRLYLDAIRALVRAVEYYHPTNKGHSERVASYAMMMARALELPPEEIDTIRSAALLHDIGKIGHFETLYRKPEGLTEEDWKQILTPLKTGLKILEPLSGQLPILPILYHFYERYDGKGFPDGLKGEEIPLGSRILALANAFDDISANTPQVSQVSFERAVTEIKKEAGTLFDPKLVRLLVNTLSHIPAEEFARRLR